MPKKQHMSELKDVGAIQHADDDYWYRPLVFGDNLFTYVAHIRSGAYMAPDAEEAELFELSLYMLEGELLIYYGEETFTITPHTALFIPRGVAFGVRNETDETATYILTFTPPPGQGSMDEFWATVRNPEKRVKTPDQIRKMIGKPDKY
jgi:quercetin dioxygenase-like cupin family protein